MRFKIGDRVKAVAACDSWTEAIGNVGRVDRLDENDPKLPILVIFDDESVGFDGCGSLWCEETSLAPEEEA